MTDFFEDEPAEDVRAAWERAEKGLTSSPGYDETDMTVEEFDARLVRATPADMSNVTITDCRFVNTQEDP